MKSFFKLFRSYKNDRSGTTAVEFGLIAGAFLLIIFGIFESGRLLLSWNSFQYALENAARFALVNEGITEQEIIDYVVEELEGFPNNQDLISVDMQYVTRSDIDFIEIDGTYDFTTVLPLLPSGWDTMELRARVILPIP